MKKLSLKISRWEPGSKRSQPAIFSVVVNELLTIKNCKLIAQGSGFWVNVPNSVEVASAHRAEFSSTLLGVVLAYAKERKIVL